MNPTPITNNGLCPKCNSNISNTVKFCPECGMVLAQDERGNYSVMIQNSQGVVVGDRNTVNIGVRDALSDEQDAKLRGYIDWMKEMLLEKNLQGSKAEMPVRLLAKLQTLATLRIVDGKRKGVLLQFLYGAGLIFTPMIVELQDADLSMVEITGTVTLDKINLKRVNLDGANLFRVSLAGADLKGANLRGANLAGVNLEGADLAGTNLEGANLEGATLKKANLFRANLADADLRAADLARADLKWANLDGANLSGANLSDVNVSIEQLGQTTLFEGTTMPDGKRYDKDWEIQILFNTIKFY